MQEGICPNCGSEDVRFKKGSSTSGTGALMISSFSAAYLDLYCCVQCGLLQHFVPATKRPEIGKKWKSVTEAGAAIFEGH